MHVILEYPHFAPLTRGEKIFLESWYNLTHDRTLDSYRVRCHNGRTILEELHREMRAGIANTFDLSIIAAEAHVLLTNDKVLQAILGQVGKVLEESLKKIVSKGDKEKDKADKEKDKEDPQKEDNGGKLDGLKIDHLLTDVLPALAEAYLTRTLLTLREAIQKNEDDQILQLCDFLASDLIMRGWAVDSLHSWVETTFLATSWTHCPFIERFDHFSARLQKAKQEFQVTLCLSGSREVNKLGEFNGFEFTENPPAITETDVQKARKLQHFLRVNPQRSFASTKVEAVDQISAGHAAVDKFSKCYDRLRFNFCPEPVFSSKRAAFVKRLSDGKEKVVPIDFRIPNPEHHLNQEEFLAANRKLEEMFKQGQLDETSQYRLEAAVRHYRLGLDGRTYPDMLLNWWMGLETLTNTGVGKGGIGEKVVSHATALLTHRYFTMQLHYLSSVLQRVCEKWPALVMTLLSVDEKHTLSWPELLRILQDKPAFDSIALLLVEHPWLEIRWARYGALVNQKGKLLDYLNSHEQRVKWHVQRLYRVRCCLVHGTPIEVPLQLLTANLEYYLRETIHLAVANFTRSKQICSLETLLHRAHHANKQRKMLLAASIDSINGALNWGFTFETAV